MQEEDISRDPLDKVSGQLRKAVGLNRHEIGGLRNVVSQMNRERNKSVGLLSKQQQDFIQKQARLLPALNARKKFKRAANQVIPLNQEPSGISAESQKVVSPKLGINGISTAQFNILPPIRSSRRIKFDSGVEGDAKERRISDYKKEFSSLQESINNAHRFAFGGGNESHPPFEGKKSKTQNTESDSVETRQRHKTNLHSLSEANENGNVGSKKLHNKDFSFHSKEVHGVRKHRKRSDETKPSPRDDTQVKTHKSEKTILINDEVDRVALANKPVDQIKENSIIYEEEEVTKRSYWNVVRERLGLIAAMNKKRHSQYLEHLYEEIRKCRYIRRPKRRNPSTGLWYESGEDSDNS